MIAIHLSIEDKKPILSTEEQIRHLKGKGVVFEKTSESDAASYLRSNNNYFKLTSYRKNYDKYTEGDNEGKYINLDFGYLRDLAIIDMNLRYTLVHLALDLEHYTSLNILRHVEDAGDDGYVICRDFFDSLTDSARQSLEKELSRNGHSVYTHDLYEKYCGNYPIWALLELLPFGRVISLYRFCGDRYGDREMSNQYYVLMDSKSVRNAAAHNSCILNDLRPSISRKSPEKRVMKKLSEINGISKNARTKRMSNPRMAQIISLLYAHNEIVSSEGVHLKAARELAEFRTRLNMNMDYYQDNELIRANFDFLEKIIDKWFGFI